jgi:hypothetical protein
MSLRRLLLVCRQLREEEVKDKLLQGFLEANLERYLPARLICAQSSKLKLEPKQDALLYRG